MARPVHRAAFLFDVLRGEICPVMTVIKDWSFTRGLVGIYAVETTGPTRYACWPASQQTLRRRTAPVDHV